MGYQITHLKYLTDRERADLEAILWQRLHAHTRDSLIFLTLLYTGARASECLQLQWDWLDASRNTLLVKGVKGSNDREVPLPNSLTRALLRFGEGGRHSDTPLIFPISYSRLKAIWENYRPGRKKIHSLRHTFAITQLKKHGRIDVIKRLLGHKNIANTMIYADYAFSDAELRALVVDVDHSAGTLARSDLSTAALNSNSVPPKLAGRY